MSRRLQLPSSKSSLPFPASLFIWKKPMTPLLAAVPWAMALPWFPKRERCALLSPGTVAALFPTEHALGIMSDDSSAQVMLHIGIDTVKLEGKGFHALVAQGDHVDAGQPLVEVDFDAVRAAGFDPRSSLSCASVRRTRLFVSTLPALCC